MDSSFSPEKGVVLQSLDGQLSLDAYLLALSKKIEPRRVTHVSRTREGVCVFLDSAQLATDLARGEGLQLGGQRIWVRGFRIHTRRLLLTNCLPFISDELIVAQLKKLGQVYLPLLSEPVQSGLENFKHVLSFNKSVTVALEDVSTVPDKLLVEYRGVPIPIYIHVEEPFMWREGFDLKQFGTSELLDRTSTTPSLSSWSLPAPHARPVQSFLARHPVAALVVGPEPEPEPETELGATTRSANIALSRVSTTAPKRRASSPLSVNLKQSDEATSLRPVVSLGVWQHQAPKRETSKHSALLQWRA